MIRLPDGSAVPASFAAALLGRRERHAIEARRRGLPLPGPGPGRLGRAAWAVGLHPSVDTIGPRAEALLRAWTVEVDRELPEIVAALEGEDRAAFLLCGWITPRTFPKGRRIRRPDGTVVSFRALTGLEPRGLSGGTSLVAASVAGPLVPRLRPSAAVAADGLLVPVGFAEEGCLYLPLVGTPLGVSGERSGELLATVAVYAQMRIGPEGCRVLATQGTRALLDPVVAAESLETGGVEEAVRVLVLERRRDGPDREAFLSKGAAAPPVAVLFLEAEEAREAGSELSLLPEVGVGAVVRGDADAPRGVSVSEQGGRVVAAPELDALQVEPALLSTEAMAEAALVLRRPPTAAPPTSPLGVGREQEELAPPRRAAGTALRGPGEPAQIKVLCLGGVRVMLGENPVEGGWRKKSLELLALLASNPEGQTRDQLLTALWPEDPPDKTGDRLRQCLRQVRQRLGAGERTSVADWVDERLRLDGTAVWSDVGAFREALEEADRAAGPERIASLRRAVSLYRGPLVQGHPYEWALPVQERLRREFQEAAHQLAELLLQAGDQDEALRMLDRALEEDPYAEHLHRLAIETEAKRGGAAAARRRYGSLRRLLWEDLGLEPSDETEDTYRDATDG